MTKFLHFIHRKSIIDYNQQLVGVAKTVCELLSEALGLAKDHLASINAAQKQVVVCHYYPPCPEPDLAVGARKHTDPSFLTILLQDSVGGLQVCNRGQWVDVLPVRGALVVNIGDLLQVYIVLIYGHSHSIITWYFHK